jgi:glycosyltransferase involved in cell wall biosynthesis
LGISTDIFFAIMGNSPTLSVLMPNYNHARYLRESLASILSQSYKASEVIVLDDASTDDSVRVIEEIRRDNPVIRLFRNERNMGVEWTVNRLLQLASGDYIYAPSADDKVLPGFFEKSMALLAAYPQAGLCSTVGRLIGEHGEDRGVRSLPVISRRSCFLSPADVRRALHKYGRWFEVGSVIYRRGAFELAGGYAEELGSFADNFSCLVVSLRHGACFVPEPLNCWRQAADGYGSRLAGNWEGLLERGRSITGLMRTAYGDLFPGDYVDDFYRQWLYMVSVVAGEYVRRKAEEAVARAFESLCPEPSPLDRAFWRVLRRSGRRQAAIWRLYFTAKFAPWRWWVLGRLSILVNLREVVIREKLQS